MLLFKMIASAYRIYNIITVFNDQFISRFYFEVQCFTWNIIKEIIKTILYSLWKIVAYHMHHMLLKFNNGST